MRPRAVALLVGALVVTAGVVAARGVEPLVEAWSRGLYGAREPRGQAVVVALVGLAVLAAGAHHLRRAASDAVAAKLVTAGALLVVAAAGLSATAPSGVPPLPEDLPERTRHFRAVANLHRAREAALAWARTETVPGPGYLNLAEIDWDLGERATARRVLAKVRDRATDPSIQSRAASLEAEWAQAERRPP